MRNIIVAGGRNFDDEAILVEVCNEQFRYRTDVLVQGECPTGADLFARQWAEAKQRDIIRCPADWNTHGRAAGPIRNKEMAEGSDVLIAFWDGQSRGTKSMINEALKAGLEVHVYRYDP